MLPICLNSLFTIPFCTLVFVGLFGPLPEMVKGVMLRARDALPAPYDFTQTWVDGAPRRGRLMFVGHSEMDGPYYVWNPTSPSIYLI